MVYTHNRILLIIKKKGCSDICYNTDTPGRHAKWNKPVPKGWMLHDSIHIMCWEYSNSEAESRMVVASGKREWAAAVNMGTVSVLQNDRSFGDWLHNNMNVLNTIELYI